MASVHVDTMTGQKELILATRFKMEDLVMGLKGRAPNHLLKS